MPSISEEGVSGPEASFTQALFVVLIFAWKLYGPPCCEPGQHLEPANVRHGNPITPSRP
jgi:hypothetical protein